MKEGRSYLLTGILASDYSCRQHLLMAKLGYGMMVIEDQGAVKMNDN